MNATKRRETMIVEDKIERIKQDVMACIYELRDAKYILTNVKNVRLLFHTVEDIYRFADENDIYLCPELERSKLLLNHDQAERGLRATPLPRNQEEVIRLMIHGRYAVSPQRDIRQDRNEYQAIETEIVSATNETKAPCTSCRDDVWSYCANTGTECKAYQSWCTMGVIPPAQFKALHRFTQTPP
jgi:hypothetical protein